MTRRGGAGPTPKKRERVKRGDTGGSGNICSRFFFALPTVRPEGVTARGSALGRYGRTPMDPAAAVGAIA